MNSPNQDSPFEASESFADSEALDQRIKGSTLEHRLLTATAKVANALLTIVPFDQAVNTALQIIGEALETDRISVIENLAPSSDSAFPVWRALDYKWNSRGTVPQHTDPEAIQGSYEEIPEFFEQLSQGQSLSYLIEEAPEPFRSAQIAIGVKSTHLVAILVEGEGWGVLGIDDCREAKRRNPPELSVLRIAADCIGSAIQRDRTQRVTLEAEQARSAELEKVNEELQQRDRLLSVVARITKDLLEAENVEVAIPAALQAVGEAASMSRVLLFLERLDPDTQRLKHYVVHEWVTQGLFDHAAVDLTVLDNEDFQSLIQPLHRGESVWHVIDEFPYETRVPFEALAIQSSGAVPIFIEGQYIGAITFDDCIVPRQWSTQEIDVLTAAAESIGAALYRKQLIDCTQQALLQAEQERAAELAKANEVLKRSVNVLATETDLNQFIGHVLRLAAQQFDAPLAEYWQVTDPNIAKIVGWWGPDQIHGFGQHHDHPAKELGVQVPAYMLEQRQFSNRRNHFVAPFDPSVQPAQGEFLSDPARWYEAFGVSWQLNFPLIVGETCFGVLNFWQLRDCPFTEQQLELGYALAQQVMLAIRLSQLAEEAKQAAIAREQEKAAQERAAELAKANEALRRGVERLVEIGNIDALLDSFLLEAVTVTGASAGAVFDRITGTEFQMRSLAQDGRLVNPADTEAFGDVLRAVSACDPVGVFSQIIEAQVYCHAIDDYFASWFPEAAGFHRQQGNQVTWNFPFRVGGEVVGYLGLAFREHRLPNQVVSETVQALGHQVSLALETLRLAEEAKQAAIAREQEKAAQERAAELERVNNVLQGTVAALADRRDLDGFIGEVLHTIARELESPLVEYWTVRADTTVEINTWLWDDQLCSLKQNHEHPGRGGIQLLPEYLDFEDMTRRREPMAFTEPMPAYSLALDQVICPTEWYAARGVRSHFNFPLQAGDTTVGAISVWLPSDRQITQECLRLGQSLSHQTALAIQLTRLVEEAKQAVILEERNRLARDIHDTLAQVLTGVTVQLQAAEMLPTSDVYNRQLHLTQARLLAQQGLTEARRSVQALRPQILEQTDLAGALSALLQQMIAGTALRSRFRVHGDVYPHSRDVETQLLRIGQEALTNLVKHANANEAVVELVYQPGQVQLRVQDDGSGFDPEAIWRNKERSGYGLIGMQERAKQIGATLTIASQPGQGTTVQVNLLTQSLESSEEGQEIRVLLADDHPIVLQGLAALIERQPGITVVAQAQNGREAIDLYRNHQPDVALIDLRMPVIDGVEAIALIRQEYPTAKIVILTTYDTAEEIYRGLQAGAMAYLLKGSSDSLPDVIRAVHAGEKRIPLEVAAKLADRVARYELTNRELEVLRLIVLGQSNKEISSSLQVSEGTVRAHINNILSKLRVRDRTQAATLAIKQGLVRLE